MDKAKEDGEEKENQFVEDEPNNDGQEEDDQTGEDAAAISKPNWRTSSDYRCIRIISFSLRI